MEDKTFESIKNIISEQLNIRAEDIKPEVTIESLGADSLDKVELMMAVEDEFEIEIPDTDMARWETVSDIQKCVESRMALVNRV